MKRVFFLCIGLLVITHGNAWGYRVRPSEPAHMRLTNRAIDMVASSSARYSEIIENRDIIEDGADLLDAADIGYYVSKYGIVSGQNTHYKEGFGFGNPPGAYEEAINADPGRRWWPAAIEAYGQGDIRLGYLRLGCVAHLLEDMGSPPHVYQIQHGLGNYWEDYVTAAVINGVDLSGLSPISYNKLIYYFDTMAAEAHANSTTLAPSVKISLSAMFLDGAYNNDADGDGLINEDTVDFITIIDPSSGMPFLMAYDNDTDGSVNEDGSDDQLDPNSQLGQVYYQTLASGLLPRVIQNTAGLLQHYHDIVNHVGGLNVC